MFRRTGTLHDPVTVLVDGEPVPAERGEPLAVALLGSDVSPLARSPKLHRPRAPSCLRGGCDGCLARVDGVPNVMTCLRAARGGERIEVQNVVGSRKADLLRVTDWFFPHGIDHHHLMAGIPGVQDVMQSFARKLAGLGRLPADGAPAVAAKRVDVDALVVGGGLAGIVVASRLTRGGVRTLLVDDGLALGGSLAGAPERARHAFRRYPIDGVELLEQSSAFGVYPTSAGSEVVVGSDAGLAVVRMRALVLATGAHDPAVAVANADLPGVFSARAVCRLGAHGVRPDGGVVIVGSGFWGDELARVPGVNAVRIAEADLVRINGTAHVRGVVVRSGRSERTIRAHVVALAMDGAPAFELAEQAGARVRHEPARGYVVERDATGRAADGVWAAGECAGLPFDPDAIAADAERVADAVGASTELRDAARGR